MSNEEVCCQFSQMNVKTEDDILLEYVNTLLLKLLEDEQLMVPKTTNVLTKFYHSILIYGKNIVRLRQLSFIFAHRIAVYQNEDIHMFRVDYKPDLIRSESVFHLFKDDLSESLYLDFLKLYYLSNSSEIVDHLLQIDNVTNMDKLVPGAIIVDDITNYVPMPEEQQKPTDSTTVSTSETTKPRVKSTYKYSICSFYKLCSMLIENINICGRNLSRCPSSSRKLSKAILIVTMDLDKFTTTIINPERKNENEEEIKSKLLKRFSEKFFLHLIDSDKIC